MTTKLLFYKKYHNLYLYDRGTNALASIFLRGDHGSNGETVADGYADHAFSTSPSQLEVLEAALAGGDISHDGAQHDGDGAEVVRGEGSQGLLQALEGVGVLLLAVSECGGHLR